MATAVVDVAPKEASRICDFPSQDPVDPEQDNSGMHPTRWTNTYVRRVRS